MSKNTIKRAKYDDANPYFIKARQTSQDKNLSYEARGMLDYLLSKPGDWEVRVNDLIIPKKCGRDKVYNILNELIEYRYMKRPVKSQGEKGRWNWTSYEVYERPYPEKPYTDEPYTENTEIKEQNTELENKENTFSPNGGGTAERKTTPRKPDPMFDAISEAWNTRAGARVGLIKGVLLGTAKKGDWKAANFDVPATPDEVKGFGAWYKRKNPTLDMPTSPATLQKWFYQYRDAQKPTPAPTPISDEEAPKPSIYGGYYQPKGEVAS